MIGRHGPVKPFDLIRWAREQTPAHDLKPLEGHILLVLATYADADAKAFPSIETLARRCGLKPKAVRGKDGTVHYANSAVSAALARLEDLQLVWTTQAGHGKPAIRELLYNPGQPAADGEIPSTASLPRGGSPAAPSAAGAALPRSKAPTTHARARFAEKVAQGDRRPLQLVRAPAGSVAA